jgi:hypothetical protein
MLAGSIVLLAAAIVGSAGVIRSGLPSTTDRDLVHMSIFMALIVGALRLALIASAWRAGRPQPPSSAV